MKKLIVVMMLVGLGGAVSSCKKEYVCKCTKTYTGNSTTVITDDGSYTYKDTQPRANDRCDGNEKQGSDLGGNYVRNCDLQ